MYQLPHLLIAEPLYRSKREIEMISGRLIRYGIRGENLGIRQGRSHRTYIIFECLNI